MPSYISEIDYDGGADSNFVEVVVQGGTDTSAFSLVVYDTDGTIIETLSFGTVVNTIAGKDVYVFDDSNPGFPDIRNDEALALVDDTGTVVQFISFKDTVTATEGPAVGTTSTAIGEHSGGDESLVSADGGSSYSTTATSDPGVIPCYAPDVLIDTPTGPVAVECLRAGDLVLTHDNGAQVIRWTRRETRSLDGVRAETTPVLITAGALGPDRPSRDMIVSPQHRIVVGGGQQLRDIFQVEVFAPAKALTGLPGIRHMLGRKSATWVHFACDRHELVRANGCWSESVLLGPSVVQGLSRFQRDALRALYAPVDGIGHQTRGWNGPPARRCLTVRETRWIIDKHRSTRRFAA